MSIETTLTLLLAAGLLLAGGLLWLLAWGLFRFGRYLVGASEPSRSKPREPIFPRVARRAGIVAGRLDVIGRRLGARLGTTYAGLKVAARLQAKPALQRTATSTGHHLATAGHISATVARRAGTHLVTIAQFVAAHAYSGMRKAAPRSEPPSSLSAYGDGVPPLPNGPEVLVHSESPYLPPRAEAEGRK